MAQNDQPMFPVMDYRSSDQILDDKYKAQVAAAQDTVSKFGYGTAPERAMGNLGATLGASLKNKISPERLSPDEQTQGDAVAATKQAMDYFRQKNPDATAEDLGLETQKTFAENLLRRGDLRGIPMMQAYSQTKQAREMAAQQIAKLTGENTLQGKELDSWSARNMVKNVFLPTDEPGARPHTAFIDNNYNAHMWDDQGKETILKPGQYSWYENQHDPNANFRNAITPTEAGQIRNEQRAVFKEMTTALMMHKMLKDSVNENGSVDFLDKSGKATNFVTNAIDNLTAIAREVSGAIGNQPMADGTNQGKDLSTPAQAADYVRKNADFMSTLNDYMPKNVRENSRLREQWLSATTSMAYALAMARKPNARQVTDADVKMAIHTIAGATTDPEAFRRVMMQDLTNDIDSFKFRFEGIQPQFQKQIIGPKAWQDFNDKYNEFSDTFGKPFGSAGAPGPGLKKSDQVLQELLGEGPQDTTAAK